MLHYVNGAFRENAPLIQRAITTMLSMAETAKATVTKRGGARFDRGAFTLIVNPDSPLQWRDTTPRRTASVDFQYAIPAREGTDPRLHAMRTIQSLSATIDGAIARGIDCRGADGPDGALRRPYVALRAAAGLAGLHHADMHISHRCGKIPPEAVLYCDGPSPYRLHDDVVDSLFEGVPEACRVICSTTGSAIHVGIAPASFEDEIEDDAMGLMRWLSECGLGHHELELRRES